MRSIYPLAAMLLLLAVSASPVFAEMEKKILYWVAPMDPNYRMDSPGKSPMGMDLVPVYDDGISSDDDADDGRVTVRINAETIQNIGVRTQKAVMADFGQNIYSYGLVTANIRQQQEISSRIDGWIEDLKITAVGDRVQKGDVIFTLYSPKLVSAQQDYLAALKTGLTGRINSAAKRMRSLGVQKQVIYRLKKTRKKYENIPFFAETNGIISKLNVKAGSFIKPGINIAEIQDYSSVWIDVSVAEKDLRFLAIASKATVSFPNLGNEKRVVSIDYIYPTINEASRTGKVRLVLDNINGKLKPGAYADVEFEANIENRLSIPSEAILKSSDGDYVVIAKGMGKFQPKKIKAGITNKGITEVISGINEGDDVVVSSQFMIDSESSLREAFRKMRK
jgi:Cu(I)/Ag(I) efflux system membrane fusion protein